MSNFAVKLNKKGVQPTQWLSIMLIREFEDRTHFKPTEKYFDEVINPEYESCDLDKDLFCKMWRNSGGVQKAYDYLFEELKKQTMLTQKYVKAYDEMLEAYERLWIIKNNILKQLNDLN